MSWKTWSLVAVALFFVSSAMAADRLRVAVMPFKNGSLGDAKKFEAMEKGLSEMMATDLAVVPAFDVVERTEIKKIVDEQKLSSGGMADPDTVVKVGKIIGAKYMLFGTFVVLALDEQNLAKNDVKVVLRLVNVETTKTVDGISVEGKFGDIFAVLGNLSKKFIDKFAKEGVQVGEADKKKIDDSREKSVVASKTEGGQKAAADAVMYYSMALDYMDAGEKDKAKEYLQMALKSDPNFADAKNKLAKI